MLDSMNIVDHISKIFDQETFSFSFSLSYFFFFFFINRTTILVSD